MNKFCVLKQHACFLFILFFISFLEKVSAETETSTKDSNLHAIVKRQISSNQRVQDDEVYYHILPVTTTPNLFASYAMLFADAFSNPNTTVTKSVLKSNGTWNQTLKIQLKFLFYFFGHPVSQIGVSSSGYVTVLEAGHEQNSSTQYIAPLKGTYITGLNDPSAVSYVAKNDSVWIRWSSMTLAGLTSKISFQAVIFKNGSMIFHYYNVPKLPSNVSVTSGLADVFIYNATNGRTHFSEFLLHKVASISSNSTVNNSLVLVTALPSCGQLTECSQCTDLPISKFSCRWCFQRGLCGSVTVQSLQSWKQYPCHTPKDATCLVNSGYLEDFDKAAKGILGFFLAIFLAMIIAFVVALCVYAHRVPESRIGHCFMKTRLELRERFLGLRVPSVFYRTSVPQVRLQEEVYAD